MFDRVKAAAITTVAIFLAAKDQYKLDKAREEYDAMIAESQAKIGPYNPASIPVQIWA